jgi:steroid 5-alpha reductase family enzyme
MFLVNGVARQSPLFWGDYASLALWVVGFVCETTADYQKFKFKGDPNNKGRFINTGLWWGPCTS